MSSTAFSLLYVVCKVKTRETISIWRDRSILGQILFENSFEQLYCLLELAIVEIQGGCERHDKCRLRIIFYFLQHLLIPSNSVVKVLLFGFDISRYILGSALPPIS
jgi:hypothetical protein